MTEVEIAEIAVQVLAEEMSGMNPRTAPESEIRAACTRFARRWTAIADKAAYIYLDSIFNPPAEARDD